MNNPLNTLRNFSIGKNTGKLYSLPALAEAGLTKVPRLPVSIRIVLESVLRNCDGKRITEKEVRELANWQPTGKREHEIPFVVSRVLLQDFTGVPLLVDLAAMRASVERLKGNPSVIEPLVPVELVVDHSVQVDFSGLGDALKRNTEMEFRRNRPRYEFLKWGKSAFKGFDVVPPEVGIVHQVNLEKLARGVFEQDGIYYPDSLVGTDSHTTMINGLGIVGWGVGGIEAEAGMLGQPVYFLTPDVLGVNLTGRLQAGVTATDLVLYVTQVLRKKKVVGKFVEFFGEGAASLAVTDRATIANMAPEYGATMGFFPIDEESCRYLTMTGRKPEQVEAFRSYYKAQGMFGIPRAGDIDYSDVLEVKLEDVRPSAAGPKRPQDRIALPDMKSNFTGLLKQDRPSGGYGVEKPDLVVKVQMSSRGGGAPLNGGGNLSPDSVPKEVAPQTTARNTNPETETEMMQNRPTQDPVSIPAGEYADAAVELRHGSVVIAAITSCTNTSNPSVMLAAGLLAKKAVEKGLHVPPYVKTSLAPGSRVVTHYLARTGLQGPLDKLGFQIVGYGCTTCIGNSGPLERHLEEAVQKQNLVVASVLSGNRNFEARVHQSVKANYLMSPPLVVAYALAGRIDIDLEKEPIQNGVYLRDLWPSAEEVNAALITASDPEAYRSIYKDVTSLSPMWKTVETTEGLLYQWNPESTYVREPPYFENFSMKLSAPPTVKGARALAIFGDSVTTDHISPAGAIKKSSPAGKYLITQGVPEAEFNTYGARRGNHEVMVRGTFGNVRIRNLMLKDTEGGETALQPSGEKLSIYDASLRYQKDGTPLVIFAGHEYGTGSSRDWAAKGTRLLGVRAVIASSFERIHRSNLVGMGVLPCQFDEGVNAQTLKLDGTESFDLVGAEGELKPGIRLKLAITRKSGEKQDVSVTLRIDTPIEVEYYKHGGILPFVLRQLLAKG